MNKKQRMSNRENAKMLSDIARQKRNASHICENCGEPGGHWVQTRGYSLEAIMTGIDDQQGFWTCSKYYDPDTSRRLPEHTENKFYSGAADISALSILASLQTDV